MSKIRLIDIAKETGLSVSTVSKALRDSQEIPKITKDHVIATAQELGYYPNFTAISLRLGRTYLLGVVIPDSNDPYYSAILEAIESKSRDLGFSIILSNSKEVSTLEVQSIHKLKSLSVDGILAVPVDLNNYAKLNIPVVFLSRYPVETNISFPQSCIPKITSNFVISDDFVGQYLATKHIIECGIKSPYFYLKNLPNNSVEGMKTQIRLAGYKKALEENNIEFDENKLIPNITTNEISYNTTNELCKGFSESEGILLINDSIATGVIRAAVENGLTIPDDLQIVGYDDIDYSKHLYPPLTTVDSAKYSIGEHGVSLLVEIIKSGVKKETDLDRIFDPYLIVRKSTKLII